MPRTDEVENLRTILSHAHERQDSLVRKAMRRVTASFGARRSALKRHDSQLTS